MNAQHLEIGAAGGFSSYNGDLSPSTKRFALGEQRYAVGAFVRYQRNDYISFKLGLTAGRLSADDADAKSPGRRSRGLSFKSTLFETSFTMEYNILGYEPKFLTKTISPYIFVGVGVFAFNPKTLYQGKWVELQPLNTEGQGLPAFPNKKPYKKIALAIPFGFGMKYALTDRINLGAEFGLRKTNTDYIDDVSTTYVASDIISENYGPVAAALSNPSNTPRTTGQVRGNPNIKDWYMISSLTVSYNLIDSGFNRKRRRPMGCPSF